MNTKVKVIAIVTAMAIVVSSCAQPKKGIVKGDSKKKDANAELLIGTKQTTLPGRPEMKPSTDYKLLVIWKSKTPPTEFFWRGDAGWLPCNVSKVTNYDSKKLMDEKYVFERGYDVQQISLEEVTYNDTLELHPTAGGKYPIPNIVVDSIRNTIFYKAGNTNWLTIPVPNLADRPDIIMQ